MDDTKLIRPLNRPGQSVALYPTTSEKELVRQVIGCIQIEQRSGRKSIAVICKSAQTCQQISDLIQAEGFTEFQLITNRFSSSSSDVLVLPAYLAKGLEFDAVILADSHKYPADDLSLRLLFVAIHAGSS